VLRPVAAAGRQVAGLPVLERDRLLFRETPIRWAEWVEAWQRDQAGQRVAPVPAAQQVLG
jgi:hypothetical protein